MSSRFAAYAGGKAFSWTWEGNEALLGIFFGRLGAEVEGPLLDNGTLLSE